MSEKLKIQTVKDVKREVSRIQQVYDQQGDDEGCHSDEDALHITVLGLIADGASDADKLAAEALKTTKIPFHRWCA